MTQLGVVYGATSGIVRYMIKPAPGVDFSLFALQKGEAIAILDNIGFINNIPDETEVQLAIEKIRGKPADDSRCVVVDAQSKVVDFILADPIIDKTTIRGTVLKDPGNAAMGAVVTQAVTI